MDLVLCICCGRVVPIPTNGFSLSAFLDMGIHVEDNDPIESWMYFIYLFYCDLHLAPCISDLEVSQHTWLTVFLHLKETMFIC